MRSLYRRVMSRQWTDGEPDTLTVDVCTDASDGVAKVVFTCSSTWLSTDQATELLGWLAKCITEADRINAHAHEDRCCPQHDTHSKPHKGCILR